MANLEYEVYELYRDSLNAIKQGNPVSAELLLNRALELSPDSPPLLNNLALAYEKQGRKEEADALAKNILSKHPDYICARVAVVNALISRCEYEEALELLKPFLELERAHVQDVAFICQNYIHFAVWLGEIEDAYWWLEFLEKLRPNDKNIEMWRQMINDRAMRVKIRGIRSDTLIFP